MHALAAWSPSTKSCKYRAGLTYGCRFTASGIQEEEEENEIFSVATECYLPKCTGHVWIGGGIFYFIRTEKHIANDKHDISKLSISTHAHTRRMRQRRRRSYCIGVYAVLPFRQRTIRCDVSLCASVSMNDINIVLCILRVFSVHCTCRVCVCLCLCVCARAMCTATVCVLNTKWWNLWMNIKRLPLAHTQTQTRERTHNQAFPIFHCYTTHSTQYACAVRTIKQNQLV